MTTTHKQTSVQLVLTGRLPSAGLLTRRDGLPLYMPISYVGMVGKGRLGVVSPSPFGNGSSGLWPRPGSPRRTAGARTSQDYHRPPPLLRNRSIDVLCRQSF